MNTIAWLFILGGILIARQVSKGRVMNLAEDLGDAFIAVASGDTDALGEVLTRTGEAAEPTAADVAIGNLIQGSTDAMGITAETVAKGVVGPLNGIAVAAIILGSKAKGYRWAATGPDYYDCSGLMWRAVQSQGFKGPRFSTANVRRQKGFSQISATEAKVNDIVLWPAGVGGITGHMGVITGSDRFYSARSVKSGIGEAKISTFRKFMPVYIRYTKQ